MTDYQTVFTGYDPCTFSGNDNTAVECTYTSPFDNDGAYPVDHTGFLRSAVSSAQDEGARTYALSEMVRYYLFGHHLDSALMVLDSFTQMETKYIKCASLLAFGMADEAGDLLTILPNSPGQSISDYMEETPENRNSAVIEQDVWYELLEWCHALVADSLTYADADSAGIVFLRNISVLDNAVSVYAENILAAIGDTHVYRAIEEIDTSSSKRGPEETVHDNDQPWLGQNIPNPFDGSTLIPVFLPEGVAWLEVHDLTSRLVWSQQISSGLSHVIVKGPDLSKGVYAYSLRIYEKVVASRKMVRQ